MGSISSGYRIAQNSQRKANLFLIFSLSNSKEDYKKLEVLAFEMEATIASLEENLAAAHVEKEELISENGSLTSELESQTENVTFLTLEVRKLQEEVSELVRMLFFFPSLLLLNFG